MTNLLDAVLPNKYGTHAYSLGKQSNFWENVGLPLVFVRFSKSNLLSLRKNRYFKRKLK